MNYFHRCICIVLCGLFFLVSMISCGKQKDMTIVKMGYIVDETGPAASYTVVQKRGVELALDYLKANGRSNLSVLFEDSKLEPRLAVNAANKLIAANGVQVIMTLTSQETKAIAPIAERSETVLLAPLPSSPELSGISPYFFRISPSDAMQGKALAELVAEQDLEPVAILYVNDIYGSSLADAFSESLELLDRQVVFKEGYVPQTRDFRTILIKIAAARPKSLFLPVYPDDAIPIMKQIKELDLDVRVLGSDTFSNPAIFENIPDLVQGVLFASPSKSQTPEFKRFADNYIIKFKEEPDINAAAAFDAVMVVAHVTKAMKSVTGKSIRDALNELQGYIGASGPIAFDMNGDVIGKEFTIYTVKGKNYESLLTE